MSQPLVTGVPENYEIPAEPLGLSNAAPQPLGIAAAGTAILASRGDHAHAHGVQAGGNLHAAVSALAAGFMTPAQLALLQNGEQRTPFDWANNFDDYRARSVAGGGTTWNHTIPIPFDLVTLVSLSVAFLPQGTSAARSMGFNIDWCAVGEPDNVNSAATATGYDAVGSQLTEVAVDPATFAPVLTPGGAIGLQIVNTNGPTLSMLYSRLRYLRF